MIDVTVLFFLATASVEVDSGGDSTEQPINNTSKTVEIFCITNSVTRATRRLHHKPTTIVVTTPSYMAEIRGAWWCRISLHPAP